MWAEIIAKQRVKKNLEQHPYWLTLFNNAEVQEDTVKYQDDIVDGRQTDVDDFDQHRCRYVEGEVTIFTWCPLLSEEDRESLSGTIFKEWLLVRTGEIVGCEKQYDRQDGINEITFISIEDTEDKTLVHITYHLDRVEINEELYYSGGYSRGGNYPDA